MAILTLKQLQEKHPSLKGRTVSLSEIKGKEETAKLTAGNIFKQEQPKGFFEKARDFATGIIGGGKLAEGAGMALAAPSVQKGLSKEQDETFALQQKLLQTIRTRRTEGADTSRLEKALKQSMNLADYLSDAQQDFAEALPTTKEIIGSSLRLAGTMGAGAITGAVAKGLALGKATGVVSGALRGAGVGAISGGAIGGIQGVGVGLEEDKTAKEIAISGGIGVAGGAIVGGAIGALTGGITGGLRGRRMANEQFAKEFVAPKETPTTRAEAIQRGRLKDPTFLEKASLEYSKRDETLAKSVEDVVSRQAKVGENIDAIRYKISQTNAGVKDFITKNKIPFNTKQLQSQLMSGKDDLQLVFASDIASEKTYNAVAKAFMENVKNKDTLGLFEARQTFDQLPAIKKLLNTAGLGENTRKEIVLAIRRSANEYIASQLPQGNLYRAPLSIESNMLEALGNIAEKSQNIIGKNKLQILTAKYPILKWLVGGIAAGAVGAAGIGVGSSIIGSTE